MRSIYPIKDTDKIMEEVNINDMIKYLNYVNKMSDGVVTRILRPDIIFVKDSKTNFEEKIIKTSIILNLSVFEVQIMDKLSEKYKFINNLKALETVSENITSVIDIIDFIKTDINMIRIYISEENDKLKNRIFELHNEIYNIYKTIYNCCIIFLLLITFMFLSNNKNYLEVYNSLKIITMFVYDNYVVKYLL